MTPVTQYFYLELDLFPQLLKRILHIGQFLIESTLLFKIQLKLLSESAHGVIRLSSIDHVTSFYLWIDV